MIVYALTFSYSTHEKVDTHANRKNSIELQTQFNVTWSGIEERHNEKKMYEKKFFSFQNRYFSSNTLTHIHAL